MYWGRGVREDKGTGEGLVFKGSDWVSNRNLGKLYLFIIRWIKGGQTSVSDIGTGFGTEALESFMTFDAGSVVGIMAPTT